MVEQKFGWLWSEENTTHSVPRHGWYTFFRRAIFAGRCFLPVPMQLYGYITVRYESWLWCTFLHSTR